MGKSEPTRFDKMLQWIKNRRVLSVIVLLGVIIIAVGSVTGSLTKIIGFFKTDSVRLEVVDIIVSQDKEKEGVKLLDIRVVNNSKKTITVSRLRLKALFFEDKLAGRLSLYEYSPISAKYNVNLGELRKIGQHIEIPIAHVLEPWKADRFVVVVGMKNLGRRDHYAWKLDTEFVTNVGIFSGPEVSIELP